MLWQRKPSPSIEGHATVPGFTSNKTNYGGNRTLQAAAIIKVVQVAPNATNLFNMVAAESSLAAGQVTDQLLGFQRLNQETVL